MHHLRHILRLIWQAEHQALLRGTALAILVLIAGLALLGLSGWFITAAGLAGLLGLGATFDIFRPSAGVRFLALGRTAARYGERLVTHDATLRALAALRVQLLAALSRQSWARLARLRGAEGLNRLTGDVDALDGLALRLVIPAIAAAVTLALALAVLAALTDPLVALPSVASFALGSSLALAWAARRGRRPSRRAARAMQALRVRVIDMLRAGADLVVYGQMTNARDGVRDASDRFEEARAEADRVEHRAAATMGIAATLAAAIALASGAALAHAGSISAAQAALGFFAMLAMAETLAPLRRGLAELGAMMDAARRITGLLAPAAAPETAARLSLATDRAGQGAALHMSGVQFRHAGAMRPVLDGFDLTIAPGEAVALMGRSGSGKSTVLQIAAGMSSPQRGSVMLAGRSIADWQEAELRAHVATLSQRSVLMRGTIADALRLAAPEADDAALWHVLHAVALSDTVAARGGLAGRLGEAGQGLSGGEARRLALARVLLRRPALLLLDEPTEGLDTATAGAVMQGLRAYAPQAAILMATHRAPEPGTGWRIVEMGKEGSARALCHEPQPTFEIVRPTGRHARTGLAPAQHRRVPWNLES